MWVWLKLKLTPKGDFCGVSVTAFFFWQISLCTSLSDTWMSIFSYFPSQTTEVRPKSANDEHPRHFCMGVLLGKQITICSTWFFVRSMITIFWEYWLCFTWFRLQWMTGFRWEVMVSWHSCTFISWEKPRELTHFIFLLLSLMLHDSKLMLKLCYLRVPTSLLTGCDTKVALDSRLSLRAWKQKLTTLNRKKQSVKGRNLLIKISLTKSSNVGSWSVEGK